MPTYMTPRLPMADSKLRIRLGLGRKPDTPYSRYGGGWNYKVGFQAGGRTLIIDLLITGIRIDRVLV